MQKMKILIVDDQAVFRKTLRVLFQQKDNIAWIEEAGNGKECIELLAKRTFDLILMDIQMPLMNGIEATKLIQVNYPETKILGMSMYASESDVSALQKAGAKGFIEKGISLDELLNVMEKIIGGGRYFKKINTLKKQD
jgi:DNA-binding NarL/FixJ family response regulator